MSMMTHQLLKHAYVSLLPILVACGSGAGISERPGAAASEDLSAVMADTVNNTIVPTYAALHARANDLATCIQELGTAPTDAKLANCKSAWTTARVPWEQSEAFLFGPVSDQGLDPAMDSWPVDRQQLDALLASSVTLTANNITSNLGGGMKGFHTIEYLLWGAEGNRLAAALQAPSRDFEYLKALTEVLAADTGKLVDAWVGLGGTPGYGVRFASAGTTLGLYSSQLDAIQELIGGMANICDEVAFGKIAEPYKAHDPNLIESQFSFNSLPDFADNIRSVRNIYYGTIDGSAGPNSIAAIVEKYDPALNRQIALQIEDSVNAILSIGEGGRTFRDAIVDPSRNAAIEHAQNQVGELMDLVNGGIMPLFVR